MLSQQFLQLRTLRAFVLRRLSGHRSVYMMPRAISNPLELAKDWPQDNELVDRMLSMTLHETQCVAPDNVAKRFGVESDSRQLVVSFTNLVTHEQAWFNSARRLKPQTFRNSSQAVDVNDEVMAQDTTGGASGTCDFCHWSTNTAADYFGRFETADVVTASNLFKYCAPHHGLLLFKRHHPLEFTSDEVHQLLGCGARWFEAAAEALPATPPIVSPNLKVHEPSLHAFLLWNCMARAGASQFHGHAQVVLSQIPFPTGLDASIAAQHYATAHNGACYFDDIWRAHERLGLATFHGPPNDRSWIFASLTPRKDAEVIIHAPLLDSASLAAVLNAALRTIIDDLGCACFNVGIYPMPSAAVKSVDSLFIRSRVVARVVSRGQLSGRASDFGAFEVFAGANIGRTNPYILLEAIKERLASGAN